jgi:hypothetical protein
MCTYLFDTRTPFVLLRAESLDDDGDTYWGDDDHALCTIDPGPYDFFLPASQTECPDAASASPALLITSMPASGDFTFTLGASAE